MRTRDTGARPDSWHVQLRMPAGKLHAKRQISEAAVDTANYSMHSTKTTHAKHMLKKKLDSI